MRATKRFVRRICEGVRLPIRAGPLRACRWSLSSGIHFLRGSYEPEKIEALRSLLHTGDVVYDIGAHMGYCTLLASITVGECGRVFAFEPLPANLRQLQRHLRWNRRPNVTVVPVCVGERGGNGWFDPGTGSGTGRVSESGTLSVSVIALDEWVSRSCVPVPNVMKIDVEGGELGVLRGAAELIRQGRPRIQMSIHGNANVQQCRQWFRAFAYEISTIHAPHSPETEVIALPTGLS